MTVLNPAMIAWVRQKLERAANRDSGQPSPSALRHAAPVTKTTLNKITKKDLGMTPFTIQKVHKVTEAQAVTRLRMGDFLAAKPLC